MTDLVDSLPAEPLALDLAEQLARRDGRFGPVTAVESGGEELVVTMLVQGRERLRGVGYDESADRWVIVAERPETGVLEGLPEAQLHEAHSHVRTRLEEWTRERYDEFTLVECDSEPE